MEMFEDHARIINVNDALIEGCASDLSPDTTNEEENIFIEQGI